MEITREIYWNVGHGPWTLIPMYLLTAIVVLIVVLAFKQRLQLYRQGLSLNRTDQPVERMANMLKNVFFQKKVIHGKTPGLFHGLFFWSFFLLLIGTVLIVVQADFTNLFFDYKFLKGGFYKLFSIVLDLAGIVAILMLAALFIRRYIFRPEGLENCKDDVIMHIFLMLIMLSGFLIEGSRMAVTEVGTALLAWSPVGHLVAMSLSRIDIDNLLIIHKVTWWFHFFLVIGFIGLIPFTKFRHILTTSANYFFADRGPKGKLVNLDLEDEDAESFGATVVTELTWKDIFDADACTLCNRCQNNCPAYTTGKSLSPMKVINQIGEAAFEKPTDNLIEMIGKDALWACTTCLSCQEICPASNEHVRKVVELRRSMVLMEGEFPGEEVMSAMEATEVNGNPLGIGYASRGDWANELGLKTLAENPDVDILYFAGCYASFDKRNIAVAKSFITLCNSAGVKVGVLGKEEKCCGEPMRKMGNEYLYQTLALENIELINSYNPKLIVTTCPHCFNTLTKDYRDLGLEINVEHHTVFLERLIQSGQLEVQAKDLNCTYHDSCYLGRHNDIYDAPRSIIKAMGGTLSEMERSKNQTFCCGAGGGRILAEEKIGERINVKRVQMAADTGSNILLSNCPFCLTMFEDGVKGANMEDQLKPQDIAEILVERLQ